MGVNCINRNSKEFKELQEKVNINPAILGAKISLWQDKNGLDMFPSVEDIEIDSSFENKIKSLGDNNQDDFLYIDTNDIVEEKETPEEIYARNAFILFNSQQGKFTARDILGNIKDNYSNHSAFTKQLIFNLYSTNAKVKFVNESALLNDDTFMQYNATTDEIWIAKSKLETASTEFVIRSFLHEVVHSVSIGSYANPTTMEAKMFKSFIDQMYNKYKNLSRYKESDVATEQNYGFKNQVEFIAEIMSNPYFQSKIKELEKGNLWTQFIDYLRTLLGFKKTSDYNTLISSITDIIKESNYKGGVTDLIFETKEETEEKSIYIKTNTIEEKLTKTVNSIKDNLEENIRKYDNIIKTLKDSTVLEEYNENLKNILSEIEALDQTEQWKGISIFTNKLNSNIASLNKRFEQLDPTADDIKKVINLYKKYLSSYSLIKDLQDFISYANITPNLPVSKDEIKAISNSLTAARGVYQKLEAGFTAYNNIHTTELLNQRRYGGEVLYRWKNKLTKEFKDTGRTGNVEEWVNEQIETTYKDEIDQEIKDYTTNIVESPGWDIGMSTFLFNSGINTNSKLVQIFQKMIDEIRNNILNLTRTKDIELKGLFDNFIKEKGNKKPSQLYKNLLEQDSEGNYYLKGEYKLSFKVEYEKQLNKYNAEKSTIRSKYGENSPEYKKLYKQSSFKTWVENNTESITVGDKVTKIPILKWRNNLSNLSQVEKDTLLEFRKITDDSAKQTFGINSLTSEYMFGKPYYRLPAITKSDFERVLEGNSKGVITDKWKDLTEIRTDDVGYEESKTDINNNPLYQIKVHYRGDISPENQSLDLFTLYRLEYKNGVNFEEKHKKESDLKNLVDVAKDKKYYRTAGIRVPVIGKFIKHNKTTTIEGTESNTYKKLVSLLETNLYDTIHKHAPKVGKVDLNKAVRLANSWTGMVGMAFNEVAAATNVLNGNAQLFLEKIGKTSMTGKSIMNAEKIYFSNLKSTVQDSNKAIKDSFVNQVNEMFDTWGTVSVSAKQAFIQNGLMKSHLNTESFQFMQTSGEHWLQSVLTMAVLGDIKVMNKDSKFIDKDGNVTTKEKAATLLESLAMKDGVLQINPSVVYTTRSIGVKMDEGGKEMIMQLVKKKIFDTMGNYDSNMQPEVMRHWYGKLFMMYRKYLIPMGIARYRGFSNVTTKYGDLKDEQLFFSEALQEYEEGFYTTFGKFATTSILPNVFKLKFDIIKSDWNSLTDYQKRNIYKTITELTFSMILLSLAQAALLAAGGDDDDNKLLSFLLLESTRLESELQSYIDPNDQFRILKSPIPSLNILESIVKLGGRVIDPTEWNEVYKSGNRKGELKIIRNVEKLIPILNSRNSSYVEKYEYIVNQTQN